MPKRHIFTKDHIHKGGILYSIHSPRWNLFYLKAESQVSKNSVWNLNKVGVWGIRLDLFIKDNIRLQKLIPCVSS